METHTKINIKSVLKSGFIAGIATMIIGSGLIPFVGEQMDEALKSRLVPPLSNWAMVYFAFVSLLLGVSIVAVNAFVQLICKSKIKTAIVVGCFFWFFCYFLSNASLFAYGFLPLRLVAFGTAWGFVELLVASIVGSKLYKPCVVT